MHPKFNSITRKRTKRCLYDRVRFLHAFGIFATEFVTFIKVGMGMYMKGSLSCVLSLSEGTTQKKKWKSLFFAQILRLLFIIVENCLVIDFFPLF